MRFQMRITTARVLTVPEAIDLLNNLRCEHFVRARTSTVLEIEGVADSMPQVLIWANRMRRPGVHVEATSLPDAKPKADASL